MLKVGLVGWRGMVGSVLIQRMLEEYDLTRIEPFFFSTSNAEGIANINAQNYPLYDAYDLVRLAQLDVIITTQGSDYTNQVYPTLRQLWSGYWIDAASSLRMNAEACIILDPVNNAQIEQVLARGGKTFVGGNCSITLPMIGLCNLLQQNLIEWMNVVTFQAASGAGAQHVRELLAQNQLLAHKLTADLHNTELSILQLIKLGNVILKSHEMPCENFGLPLIGNIIPWIDSDLGNGSSREEWKGQVELNKIMGFTHATDIVKVGGFCIRVGALRSHSTAITFRLRNKLSLSELAHKIQYNNPWIKFIPNTKADTLDALHPLAASETLQVHVGRLKAMPWDENVFGVMTVGDQLLWGAAEPLRRMLNILVKQHA